MVMRPIDMQVIHVQSDRREEWNTFVAQERSFALLQSWEWGEFKVYRSGSLATTLSV
jgi:hypothetical protein